MIKRRGFTSELLLWMFLLILLPFAGLLTYFYMNSISGMRHVEEEKALVTSRTVQHAIVGLGDAISGVTITNGYWEANREALLTRDMDWLQSNIGDMPSIVPGIDFAAEADTNGNVVIESGGVAEFKDRIAFPQIMDRFEEEYSFTGLVNTSRGLAVIAVSAVTDEKGLKSPAGVLVTGQLLKNVTLLKLKGTLQTDLALLTDSGQYLSTQGGLDRADLERLADAVREGGGASSFNMDRRDSDGNYLSGTAAPLRDMAGNIIGVLHTQMPSMSVTGEAKRLNKLILYVAIIMLVLVLLVVYLLRRRIVMPLKHFTATLSEAAAGRLAQDTPMPKQVKHAEVQIVEAVQQVIQWNQSLEKKVQQRTAEIRSLLDHARQGFLSIGPDRIVRSEYSRECVRLFGLEPAGLPIGSLLYPDLGDEAEREIFEAILEEFWAQEDTLKQELIFSLLPEELTIGERTVRIAYEPIPSEENGGETAVPLMLVLTDLTDTRQLESRMQQERRILQMVVQTITHPEDYANIAGDFERFHETELQEMLTGAGTPAEKAAAINRMIHTFKGSFSFLQFIHMVPKLHELESRLEGLLAQRERLPLSELQAQLQRESLSTWMEEDMDLLRSVLGAACDGLLLEQSVKLDREQWQAIEQKLEETLVSEEDRKWLELFRTWRYRPVRALFKPYAAYLTELAERSGILLRPVELLGGDIPVDPDHLYGFARSFVHVVRNAIVHGIEPPDERIAAGKDEYGTVMFVVEREADGLRIRFGDDGRGINPEALRAKAIRLGMSEVAASGSEAEILQLIFEDQLSTAEQVTEWGGRGVGLSAVKEEVDQLGGKIEIASRLGEGTSFVFTLPDQGRETEGEQSIGI